MELSGNVWERLVTVAAQDSTNTVTNAGLFDRDRHGDGLLGDDGQANVATWPGPNALGSNYRGGNWTRPDDWARVGDRQFAGSTIPDRTSHRGIRGAAHRLARHRQESIRHTAARMTATRGFTSRRPRQRGLLPGAGLGRERRATPPTSPSRTRPRRRPATPWSRP
jgi:hypothetical protein